MVCYQYNDIISEVHFLLYIESRKERRFRGLSNGNFRVIESLVPGAYADDLLN